MKEGRMAPMGTRPDPAADAFAEARRLVRAQARVVRVRIDAWAERTGDRDALHDARTSLRRLRVLVRSFRRSLGPLARRGVRRRLREAFKATSVLRDVDVFATWLITLPPSPATRHLAEVSDAEASGRSAPAARQMMNAWDGARRRLQSAKPKPVPTRLAPPRFGTAAASALRVEVREVDRGLLQFDPGRAPAAVHQTRIAAKRLRYLIEALSGRSPDARRAVEWCRALQDLAGEWRDATLASRRVRACPRLAGRDVVLSRLADRRRRSLRELRAFVADRGAWQIARRDALAIARRYALGSRSLSRRA